MDKEEKRRKEERRKKLKKKKREFVRAEKRSIIRQKRERRLKKKRYRRRNPIIKSFNKFLDFFKEGRVSRRKKSREDRYIRKKIRQDKIQHFKKRFWTILNPFGTKKSPNKDDRINKEIRKGIRQQQIDEFFNSLRKVFRIKKVKDKDDLIDKEIQKGIRKQQIDGFIKSLRKPFVKKVKDKDDLIDEEIQKGIRKQQIDEFLKFPERMANSYRKKRKEQKIWFSVVRYNFLEAVSGFSILKQDRLLRRELLKSYINSFVGFVLAFMVMYLIGNLASIFAAKQYSIPAVLHSYRIFWPLYTYSSLYSRQALIIIFSAGPLLSFLLAILFFQILKRVRYFRINLKTVLIWVAFHALNLFFGAYIVGVITRTGFVYTTEWLFYSQIFDLEEIIFLIISVIILFILGFHFTRFFLLSSNNNFLISSKVRVFYLISKVLLPWLTGVVFLYLLNYPNNPPELILLLVVSVLMIIPVFVNFNSIRNKNVELMMGEDKEFIGWIYLFAAILFIGFYRFILFNGISFG